MPRSLAVLIIIILMEISKALTGREYVNVYLVHQDGS